MGISFTSGIPQRRGFERAITVVETFEPAMAGEFIRITKAVLDGLQTDAEWSNGLLNRTGGPIEFSFSSFREELRYNLELGGAETAPEDRLARGQALIRELGPGGGSANAGQRLQSLQEGHSLAWGAWLGVRQSPGTTTFKVYAEIPPEASEAAEAFMVAYLGFTPAVGGVGAPLVMAGHSTETERCEFYFEMPQGRLNIVDIEGLLARVGLEKRTDALLDLLHSFEFRRGSESIRTLPAAQWGFSYSVLPDCREPVFSLFVSAQNLAGGDGLVRRQVLAAAHASGWKTGCYEVLSEPLAAHPLSAAYHNMITFSVASAPVAGITASLCPPPFEWDL